MSIDLPASGNIERDPSIVTRAQGNVKSPQDVLSLLEPDGKTHLAYLDGLRALAALYVVLSHVATFEPSYALSHDLPVRLMIGFFNHGREAVVMFITLSGFCLMLPVVRDGGILKKGAMDFFIKRSRRILPPYMFSILLSLALIYTVIGTKTGTQWDDALPVTSWAIAAHLLMIHDFFSVGTKIDFPLWSVGLEWRIYFLFPLLVASWARFGGLKTTLVTLIVSLALSLFTAHVLRYYLKADFVGFFAAGMLAAAVAYWDTDELRRIKNWPWKWALPVALGFWFTHLLMDKWPDPQDETLFCIFSICLLISTSRPGPNILRKILSARPLPFIGGFSYSIYLIHAPLIQLFIQYPFERLQHQPAILMAMLVIVAFPAIVGLSYLFHLVCERPFMNTVPRREITIA
jgi:peptidoglycan/LPS O-acetylase OafA/YrhL